MKIEAKDSSQLHTQHTVITAALMRTFANRPNLKLIERKQTLAPESQPNIESLDSDDLITKYPIRYGIYLEALRASRNKTGLKDSLLIEMYQDLSMLNGVDQYLVDHRAGRYQVLSEANLLTFQKISEALEQGKREGYFKSPTGRGKGVVSGLLAEVSELPSLYITNTGDLVRQVPAEFRKNGFSTPVSTVTAQKKDLSGQMIVTTFASFDNSRSEVRQTNRPVLLVDEAHHGLTKIKREAIESYPARYKIGFTATPGYGKDKHVGQLLKEEYHAVSIREGVEEGSLSPFSVYLVLTDVDLSQVKMTVSGEYDQKDLEEAVNIERRNQAIIELYQNMFSDQSGFVNCVGINHAVRVAEMFQSQGIPAGYIHGKMKPAERKQVLDLFEAGTLKILTSAQLLVEGINQPRASVCFNAKPTMSIREAEQRGGRVLRKDPNNPDKYATIIDIFDTDIERKGKNELISFARVAEAAIITRLADKVIKANLSYLEPLPSPIISIEGLRVLTHPKEVMFVLDRKDWIKRPEPKFESGWTTYHREAAEHGISDTKAMELLRKYRSVFKNSFRIVISPQGNPIEHFRDYPVGTLLFPEMILQGLAPEDLFKGEDRTEVMFRWLYRHRDFGRSLKNIEPTPTDWLYNTGDSIAVDRLAGMLGLKTSELLIVLNNYYENVGSVLKLEKGFMELLITGLIADQSDLKHQPINPWILKQSNFSNKELNRIYTAHQEYWDHWEQKSTQNTTENVA